MTFKHDLIIGTGYNTEKIQETFNYPTNQNQRGMRYSQDTQTLVLINKYNSLYENIWVDGILYYTGMGLNGNQSFTFQTNRYLTNARFTGVKIYLFDVCDDKADKKYIFRGQFELYTDPFISQQTDTNGNLRDVCIYPLKPLNLDKGEIQEIESKKHDKIKNLSSNQLLNKIKKISSTPAKYQVSVTYYTRNKSIKEWTERRAEGVCELCESPAPFTRKDGSPYLEIHHIKQLSEGGDDSIENTVAVCPNCHRKLHHAPSQEDLDKLLKIDKFKQ